MKQPELGRKISELRKAKGLTQEELVEKCNISVRTIQRIETGEVTPRMYTIKTILAALDYNLDAVSNDSDGLNAPLVNKIRDFMLADADMEHSPRLINQLNVAWVAGVIYFILGFFEAAAEYSRFTTDEMIFSNAVYVAIKVCALVAYVFFIRGLIAISGIFENYLLKITSMVLIGATFLMIAYDIVSIFFDPIDREAVLFSGSITFGAVGIIFGIALRRLERSLGRVAEFAGIIEIMAACFFVTIIFAFMGLIVQIPAVLLEIILIYKTMEIVKSKRIVNTPA
jgi:transcriptional regulator with XRE-family HTH domain